MNATFNPADPFADLESDFDSSNFSASNRTETALKSGLLEATAERAGRTLQATNRNRIEVKCDKCRGTGRFISYSGRDCGECFTCKGKGTITRAANYEQAKAARDARKQRVADEQAQTEEARTQAWAAAHPAEYRWMNAKSQTFGFAQAMCDAVVRFGSLTDNQLAAVQKCMARDDERQAAVAAKPAPVVGIDSFPRIEKLVRDQNLKLHLGDKAKVVMFQSGAVAVVGPQFGTGTFGIIEHGGALRRFKAMTEETFTRLQAVEARGLEAVKEIGIATGRCCVCGRTLTDEGSIEAGIGPVCATRMEGF